VEYRNTPLALNFLATKYLDDNALWKCIAGTAALFKLQIDRGSLKPESWGVITNVRYWRFIRICRNEEKGVTILCSEILTHAIFHDDFMGVSFIYRAIYQIIKSCYEQSEEFERLQKQRDDQQPQEQDCVCGRECT